MLTPKWTIYNDKNTDLVSAPAVVKPNDNGSSIGVKIAETGEELQEAVQFAMKYSKDVLIEEKIVGREFSVGILDHEALPIIELIPKQGFYNYENKYQEGATEEIVSANIDNQLCIKIIDVII
ncbi:ATP-grasp domain-containing protein [Streptococcus dysgalactiae]|nr:ATP-grasp domain-containing protein [Streptococcus dysgalactiae]